MLDEQENPGNPSADVTTQSDHPAPGASPVASDSPAESHSPDVDSVDVESHAAEPVAAAEQDTAAEPVAEAPSPAKPEPVPTATPAPSNGRSAPQAEVAADEPINKEWYILKVQSNREESIKEGLLRRVAMAGLERYFDECIVPTEMVSEFKGGKKRITKRKLYPGYLVVHMEINDDTWYLVRETPGIGDFTGSVGRPSPMAAADVQKILAKSEEKTDEAPKLKISFKKGDRVKINEGTFENFEGEVDSIDEANGRVIVMINIFGRSTPVELEYWQIEAV